MIVHVLAVHRLVQLWTTDRVARPLRARVARWAYTRRGWAGGDQETFENLLEMDDADVDEFARDDDAPPAIVYLAYCWWCFGLWASIGAGLIHRRRWWTRHAAPALATSTAVVIVAHVVSRLAPPDK